MDIVTPEQVVFSEDIVSLVVPGVEGSLGVLAGHAPLMTELRAGDVWMRRADGTAQTLWIGGGFMEVARDHAVILADSAGPGTPEAV
ncbi:MAG TPA: ATP synthase F1 subunit epsilon [Armatimonadota bacterium]|nr:ATP synthase F1 subunit epsilon [Armatimonadota bacterium]